MPAVPGSPPVVLGVKAVPGTAAARAEANAKQIIAGTRPHVLLDPDLASRPVEPKITVPKGLSPQVIADKIVAQILQGTGPILLCVPGTLGAAYETSMLSTARQLVKQAGDQPVSVASIPYPNNVVNVVTRFLKIGTNPDANVLVHVLRKLKAAAPHRPILLTGESLGAWLIAQTLHDSPELAAAVTRVVLFAKPGFVKLPTAVGTARLGAATLPGTPQGNGIVEWRHTDDIVPNLFSHLGLTVAGGFATSINGWLETGEYEYLPHHYDAHGAEAAAWLLRAVAPSGMVHHSTVHPPTPIT